MKKVLIPTKLNTAARELLEANGNYAVVQDEQSGLEQIATQHVDAYALIVRSENVTPEIIDSLPSLKVIIRAGAGYNTIDTAYARTHGIDVMNTPGANANAVAEQVLAMMLADARHLIAADPSTREGKWEKKKFMGREISGKTLGVVGLGYIGQTLVKRLRGFEMRVVGYDPVLTEDRARDLGVELLELAEVFQQADYVSLHVPENDQTRHMVSENLLSKMKNGATIINCARAGIMNETDLAAARTKKNLRFLNDVYPVDGPGEKKIAKIADIMLPHLGASTIEANQNAAIRAAEELIEFDEKGITSYIVNRDIPPGLDEVFGELAYAVAKLCRCIAGLKSKLKLIESSFYGDLSPYSKWLLRPVISALFDGFDRSMAYSATLQYLKEMGVEYEDRMTDEAKGFKSSITIDLSASVDDNLMRHASVRGTITEGNLTITRINSFDKLYFEPAGHNLIFTYADRPGILGLIGATVAEAGINIEDVRNPHDAKCLNSLALLKVNRPVPEEVVRRIAKSIDAQVAVYVHM